jgi:glycosyltransferase involved in cell wall biosynthesis
MNVFYWITGSILAFAWFSRILDATLGMPSLAEITRPEWDLAPSGNPRISIIVPALNEEDDIEEALLSLLRLDYQNYELIAVNDRSTDRTGEVMDRVAGFPAARERLKIIHLKVLPAGWLGKPHAMWSAAQHATGEWLLFTDADVIFRSDSVRRAVAYAEKEAADHVVLFPSMVMKNPGEKMMIAFFQTLFVFGHRPWKVADPKTRDHIGVGAFNLVRRKVYDAVGTYQALRMDVLDDMKLGKVVKNAGFRQRNVFGQNLISIRWAKGTFGVVRNLSKNFFAVLSFQWPRAVASAFGAAFLNLLPFVGIFLAHGWARLPFAVALLSMFAIYVGMSWKSSIAPYYFLLHPVSTVLFIYTILLSMTLALSNGGITWRGTFYPLDELRKGRV